MAAQDKSSYEIFEIRSNDGTKTVDLSSGVITFSYFENVLSPMVTAQAIIVNTGNVIPDEDDEVSSVYNGLPLNGGEKVSIKIPATGEGPGLEFTEQNDNELYVASITNVLVDAERETFTINLVSREAITNETSRVGKKFPSSEPISDSIKEIIKKYLLSDKNIDVDETQNPYGFIGNMKKPFTLMTWLASKSVPATASKEDSTAGYFFFETQEGFRFKSIDQLIDQEPFKEKYVYTPGVVDYKKKGNDFKILEYSTSKNQNLLENLERGAYCSHRKYLNPLTFEYTPSPQTIFKLDDYSGKIKNLVGDIDITLPTLSENDDRTLASVPSRYITGILDIGTLENDVSTDENADPTKIHSQAMMRYNILFTQLLIMTIPLNTNLKAGDVIDCEFPRIDREKRKEIDPHQSGLYMIKEIVHYFDATGSYSKLKLVRDTFGVRDK